MVYCMTETNIWPSRPEIWECSTVKGSAACNYPRQQLVYPYLGLPRRPITFGLEHTWRLIYRDVWAQSGLFPIVTGLARHIVSALVERSACARTTTPLFILFVVLILRPSLLYPDVL